MYRNIKGDKEGYITKEELEIQKFIYNLIFIPISILMGILIVMMIFVSFDTFVVAIVFLLIIFLFLIAKTCIFFDLYDRCINKGEKITRKYFYQKLTYLNLARTTKEERKTQYGVEGIITGKEFSEIDRNKDGRILLSEFYPLTEKEIVNKILTVDTNFSKTEFYSYVKSILVKIQEAFTSRQYKKLRFFEEDALYYNHKSLIENKKNIYDNITLRVKGVLLKDFKIEGNKQIIVVAITVVNESSWFGPTNIPIIMSFARNKDFKTNSKLSTTNCCNCGAVIDVDDYGKCTYCNTSLVSGELGWVLIDIKEISLSK